MNNLILLVMLLVSLNTVAAEPRPTGVFKANTTLEQICTPNYTVGIRPSSYTTNKIKRKLLNGRDPKKYILDHYISLGTGGDPISPDNLWLQTVEDSKRKDILEMQLRKKLCSNKITIDDIRYEFDSWK